MKWKVCQALMGSFRRNNIQVSLAFYIWIFT